jgi:TonB family protein
MLPLYLTAQTDSESQHTGRTLEASPIRIPNPTLEQSVTKKRARGQIVLSVHVSTDGTVTDAQVLRGDARLAEPVVEAVKQRRYLPAMRDGAFVESDQRITFSYNFGKGESQPDASPPEGLGEPPANLFEDLAEGKIFRAGPGSGVTPPRAVFAPDPEYSEEARRDKFKGHVMLGVIVAEDGTPENVWVIQALGHGLDRASVETIKRWKFKPATKDGQPVPVILSVETTFDIY